MAENLKLLSLPVELYQREFELNLYLGMVAANCGYQVLIGEQNEMIFKKVKHGIYFHKDHADWSEPLYRAAKKRQMKTAALDVEGLIYKDAETYISSRANKWILDNIDIVFTWGEHQKNLLEKVASINANIITIGSPKIDVCILEKNRSSKIAKGTARSILINTRFGLINSLRKEGELQNFKELGILRSEEDIQEFMALQRSERVMLDEFLLFIKLCSEEQNLAITLRPHPAESDEIYLELSRNYKNVVVDKDSDLRSQILSHDVLIHDGCTTAIEARALGKIVLGLRPENLEMPYANYANKYSYNFRTAHDLMSYVINTNIEDYKQPDCTSFAVHSIHNWNGINRLATYEIVDHFCNLDVTPQKIITNSVLHLDIKKFMFTFLRSNKFLLKSSILIFGKKAEKFFRGRTALEKKFPKIDYDKIKERIKYLNELDPVHTPPLSELKIKLLSDKTFLLYK